MKTLFTVLVVLIAIRWANAQTWQALGPKETDHSIYGVVSSLAFDPRGIPYVAYQDAFDSDKIMVSKFNGNFLETVGNAHFSNSPVYSITMAIDSMGTPYVAYYLPNKDNITGKGIVQKFNGNEWEIVGDKGFAADSIIAITLALDFRGNPYIAVSDTKRNGRVTIKKFNGSTWETIGNAGFSKGYASPDLVIDPVGTPYVAYSDKGNENKATVMRLIENRWQVVGNEGFSLGEAGHITLALDPRGIPYVVFMDMANGQKATVMKLSGSSWATVGEAGFSKSKTWLTTIAVDRDGTPYVTYETGENDNEVAVVKFNGSKWESVGYNDHPIFLGTYPRIAIDRSGTPFVVYSDTENDSKASVKKFKDNHWERVGIAGFSNGLAGYFDMDLASNGTLYVAYSDKEKEGKATVMKYDGSEWVTIGKAGFSDKRAYFPSISLDSTGTPYVAFLTYSDNTYDYQVRVNKLNGSNWVSVGTEEFAPRSVSQPVIAIDSKGMLYLEYTDQSTLKGTVMKFNGHTWESLGFTGGASYFSFASASLVIHNDGTPYVSYSDHVPVTVKKYNGSGWEKVGKEGELAYTSTLAFNDDGTLYMAYRYGHYENQIAVSKFNGSNWERVGNTDISHSYGNPCLAIDPQGTPYVTFTNTDSNSKTMLKRLNGDSWETVGNIGFLGDICMKIDSKGTINVVVKSGGLWAYQYKTTATFLSEEMQGSPSTVRVWPNPFTDRVSFGFSSPVNTTARLELFAADGSKVAVLFDDSIKKGQLYQADYQPKHKSSSLLFYRLILGNRLYSGKLIHMEK